MELTIATMETVTMIQTVLPVAVAKTLVFFDLETTSLPSKMQRAHITEMAFVAVDRGHFETQQKPPFRVLNKLALCIRPPALIHPIASQKSGMTNQLLVDQCSFREALPALRAFLGSLAPPVCLLAHNGDAFDFPVLRDELNHSGDSGYLSNLDIIVCDTLKAMRKVAESLPPPAKRGKAANSFSLDALYRRFCGRRSNAHQAEQDCMDLLKVCHHDRKSFLAYVDANAVQFGTAVFPIR